MQVVLYRFLNSDLTHTSLVCFVALLEVRMPSYATLLRLMIDNGPLMGTEKDKKFVIKRLHYVAKTESQRRKSEGSVIL
jgi:hypothetical protein